MVRLLMIVALGAGQTLFGLGGAKGDPAAWRPAVAPATANLPAEMKALSVVCAAAERDGLRRATDAAKTDADFIAAADLKQAAAQWLNLAAKLTGETAGALEAGPVGGLAAKLTAQPLNDTYRAQLAYCRDNAPPMFA